MRQKYKTIILLLVMVITVWACIDLVEESIEEKTVVIIAPANHSVTQTYTQTFWWEEVEGALNYRLQIVYNKFDSATEFRLDTLLTKNRFTVTLKPAKYQWRVQAANGSSKTSSNPIQDLTVDSSSIAAQDLILNLPADNYFTNNPEVNFSWQPLAGATEYKFEVFAENDGVIADTLVPASEIIFQFEKDSAYSWQVTGKRNAVMSNTSARRFFTLDRVAPDSIKMISPLRAAHVASPVTLSWSAPAAEDLSHYEIFIFKDTDGNPFNSKYNPFITRSQSAPLSTSFIFNEGTSGNRILWRVRAVDKAGNKSSNEKIRSFIIQ
jgi:hypothetical protein